ncbi:MAG: DoxX family protein [Acidimicrobiia bacterium]
MDNVDLGLLLLRVGFGLSLAYHGYNKVFGAGGLEGTARWFGSIGMKYPALQARLAAATEIGSGVMFAVGFLTPLAAAGMIGVMLVATIVAHWKVGFFVFKPGQGWEYTGSIALLAFCVATIGAGRFSIDRMLDLDVQDWWGAAIAGIVGVGAAVGQLALFYRPAPPT